MADKSELAKQATFLVSKVSKDVYGVDTMTGNLEAGRFKIGAGATDKKVAGRITPGTKLGGMVPIISDNHLLLHDKSLYGDHGSRKWKEWYTKYAGMTKMGVIILAGTPENFSEWAKSKACREEVAEVPDGRLWAFVDGYIISVNVKAATASATVSNGKGAIVWASGNYYKGDLKGSKMHGVGTFQWAGGTKYVGQFENSDFNGTGTKTHANGKVEKGRWKDDKFLG